MEMNVRSARRAAEFVNIMESDALNRVTCAAVPGHNGKTYEVRIARTTRGGMLSTCKCQVDGSDCPGSKNNMCYHVLAALVSSAARLKPKVRLSFCETKEAAQALVNIAGRMFPLKSKQSSKQVWAVAVQDIDPNELLC
jgi:cysteine sulfinate desulfinase/cysteine desulfurase-like protein